MIGDSINWPGRTPRPPRLRLVGESRVPPRWKRTAGWFIGLAALPLSLVPFLAYAHYDRTGSLLFLRLERYLSGPAIPTLPAGERRLYATSSLHYSGALTVLVCHGVLDRASTNQGGEGMVLSTSAFARDMRMLVAAGYQTVSPEQVLSFERGQRPLPPQALLLTFDDGRADTILNAAPILRHLQMRATAFVIGGAYDRSPVYYASPEQLRGLQKDGWSIEAHAVRGHVEIDAGTGRKQPYMTAREADPATGGLEPIGVFERRVDMELHDARAAAEAISGRPVVAYAWPFGAYGRDDRANDPRVLGINLAGARKTFALAFNDDQQGSYTLATGSTDPVRIPRLRLDPTWTTRELWQRLQVATAASAPEVTRG